MKVNVDTCWKKDTLCGSIGVVVRDSSSDCRGSMKRKDARVQCRYGGGFDYSGGLLACEKFTTAGNGD